MYDSMNFRCGSEYGAVYTEWCIAVGRRMVADGHWRSVHRGGIVGSLIQFVAVRVVELLGRFFIGPPPAPRCRAGGTGAGTGCRRVGETMLPTSSLCHTQRVLGMRCEDALRAWV